GLHLSAISLGPTSGSVIWTQIGNFGGSSVPTIVGKSVVLAGPGQYYAFDQATGAENHFHSGNVKGGGGTTVAYDATRREFYVKEDYNEASTALSAYHYTDNNHIQLLWQRKGAGVGSPGPSVAIGPNGDVYSAGYGVIWELDSTTGVTLRSISGKFADGMTPVLSNGVLWAYTELQTLAYDLLTLQLLHAFDGSRGSSNETYDAPGDLVDGHFLLTGNLHGFPGFDVYAEVPEPDVVLLVALGLSTTMILVPRGKSACLPGLMTSARCSGPPA
ncbi:MAG: hypothetical protein WA183_00520, partial [Chthoniobacterales bacterium]